MSVRVAVPVGEEAGRPLRPGWLRARVAKWPGLLYRVGLGWLIGGQVMMLTTRGRVSGKVRRTAIWYVREGDTIYCLSGWGASSDWFRNLRANPEATIQVGRRRWQTRSHFIDDRQEVERVLQRFYAKYGRLVPVFYHLERLRLVEFQVDGNRAA